MKRRLHAAQCLADQQRQRPLSPFIIVAEMLLLFYAGKNRLEFRRVVINPYAHLLGLHHDVTAPSQITDQNATLIPHHIRVGVLETVRHLLHGIHMHAALVRERGATDPRLATVGN